MHFIGDVHGKITPYLKLLQKIKADHPDATILQLGDMGLGFPGVALPPDQLRPNERFIRGNHDDPAACRAHPNYAGDFGVWPEHNLFYLGGAWSIDHHWRQVWNAQNRPKKVWWEDEELSQVELDAAYELYVATKPELVATHEAPTMAAKVVLAGGFRTEKADCAYTRTSIALQRMFGAHQPRHWVFGHYHKTTDFRIPDHMATDAAQASTRFHCLTELAVGEWD